MLKIAFPEIEPAQTQQVQKSMLASEKPENDTLKKQQLFSVVKSPVKKEPLTSYFEPHPESS